MGEVHGWCSSRACFTCTCHRAGAARSSLPLSPADDGWLQLHALSLEHKVRMAPPAQSYPPRPLPTRGSAPPELFPAGSWPRPPLSPLPPLFAAAPLLQLHHTRRRRRLQLAGCSQLHAL